MATLNYDPRPPERRIPPAPSLVPPSGTQTWRPWIAFGGAAIVALGSLLPWVTATTIFGSISMNGIDGDGRFTLVLAVVFTFMLLVKDRALGIFAGLVALAILAVGFYDLSKIQDAVDEFQSTAGDYGTAQVGVGLWLVIIGAVGMLIGVFGHNARMVGPQGRFPSGE